MIFNSITRDLNQQDSASKKLFLQRNNQSSYFPQKQFTPSNIFENIPEATYQRQKNQSRIAKMNSKISQNIDYLRYKDKLRTNQLRSSRVSCSSNRSHRSNHSSKSVKTYLPPPTAYFPGRSERADEARSYLPSQQSKIKTFAPPQTHLSEERGSKNNYNYWKQQAISSKYQKRLNSDQFKYFTRNPITIDTNYCPPESRQPERDVNQSLQRSSHSNNSESLYDYANSHKPKLNTMPTEYQRHTTGLEWNASFGSSMRNSKITPSNDKSSSIPLEAQKNQGFSKPDPSETLSPLSKVPPAPAKSKNGLIISAGLIALGVLILLLQILK